MMGLKVGASYLHCSQSVASHSPSLGQTLASAISSPSSKKYGICRLVHRSAFLGTSTTKLSRTRSCDNPRNGGQALSLRRACSANLNEFHDEEFAEDIRELALRFHLDEEQNDLSHAEDGGLDASSDSISVQIPSLFSPSKETMEFPWLQFKPEPPDWSGRDEIDQANLAWKANSVDIPLSLRIIKKKKQWEGGFAEAGEFAYCSVKRAFSSMVFIIRELHSYTLQMRELLYFEDLQDILTRVQKEMHASFVWLFQQVFSHTPTLMVSVMILLANFTVYSMGNNTAIAAAVQPPTSAATEIVTLNGNKPKAFDSSSAMKSFSLSSLTGNAASVGGQNGGGGGKFRPVTSGTEGYGRFDDYQRTILPEDMSQYTEREETESTSVVDEGVVMSDEERKLWNSMKEEAMRMEGRGEALDLQTIQRLVAPVKAEIESEDQSDYLRIELLYQMALSQEPNNPLILANYAQFLYLVVHDHDRAEEYFKMATRKSGREGEGKTERDAEALSKYANFLWLARNDITAAEETFLEAIDAEPGNTYHAATYANFLWNTGGEDTCFPIDSEDNDFDNLV